MWLHLLFCELPFPPWQGSLFHSPSHLPTLTPTNVFLHQPKSPSFGEKNIDNVCTLFIAPRVFQETRRLSLCGGFFCSQQRLESAFCNTSRDCCAHDSVPQISASKFQKSLGDHKYTLPYSPSYFHTIFCTCELLLNQYNTVEDSLVWRVKHRHNGRDNN